MTLKSVREDLQARTLSAISGWLGRLAYLSGLRQQDGSYTHWGLSRIHGEESAQRALGDAHKAVLSTVLRTPIGQLRNDVQQSCQSRQVTEERFMEELQEHEAELLPLKPGRGAPRHLSSVLHALSALVKSPR
jgi:hypothetical protein